MQSTFRICCSWVWNGLLHGEPQLAGSLGSTIWWLRQLCASDLWPISELRGGKMVAPNWACCSTATWLWWPRPWSLWGPFGALPPGNYQMDFFFHKINQLITPFHGDFVGLQSLVQVSSSGLQSLVQVWILNICAYMRLSNLIFRCVMTIPSSYLRWNQRSTGRSRSVIGKSLMWQLLQIISMCCVVRSVHVLCDYVDFFILL